MAIITGQSGHAFDVTPNKTTINKGESITFTVSHNNPNAQITEIRWYEDGDYFAVSSGPGQYTFTFNNVGNIEISVLIVYIYEHPYTGYMPGSAQGIIPITVVGSSVPTPTPNKSIVIAATSGGTTTPVPGVYFHPQYHFVLISAIPNQGYHFIHWLTENGTTIKSQTTNIRLDTDKSVLAIFEADAAPPLPPTTTPSPTPSPSTVPPTVIPGQTPTPTPKPTMGISPPPVQYTPIPTFNPSDPYYTPITTPDTSNFLADNFVLILVTVLSGLFIVILFTSRGKKT